MPFRKFELFIANRLLRGQKTSRNIRPAVLISICAISLSSAVMIVTASVIRGFKHEITEKVTGFGSHIMVSHYESKYSYETRPITQSKEIEALRGTNNIEGLYPFVTKPGILKNGEYLQANVLKGISNQFDFDFFEENLLVGNLPNPDSLEILLSSNTASTLNVKSGDNILLYFIQDPPRVRKLRVSGIYETGFGQFDELIGITSMKMLQFINDWDEDQISGYEISIKDFNKLNETAEYIYGELPHHLDVITIHDKHPDIFNWLELQDINYIIILALMILVAAINAISALLILILEKTSSIGIFKALGFHNGSVQRIFILQGIYLLGFGLILGNLGGLGIGLIQMKYGLITLSVESYYLSAVPIKIELLDLLSINLGTIIICAAALILPSRIISRIQVIKVLKFD